MKEPLKTFFRVAGVVVGLGAAAWALREKLLPAPVIPEGPAPKFRTAPSKPPAVAEPDDLTKVKGIGPVYAERLAAAGFDTFASVADGDAEAIGSAAGVSAETAKKWVKAASDL